MCEQIIYKRFVGGDQLDVCTWSDAVGKYLYSIYVYKHFAARGGGGLGKGEHVPLGAIKSDTSLV